jgi:hypothetical protein
VFRFDSYDLDITSSGQATVRNAGCGMANCLPLLTEDFSFDIFVGLQPGARAWGPRLLRLHRMSTVITYPHYSGNTSIQRLNNDNSIVEYCLIGGRTGSDGNQSDELYSI